MSLSLSDVKNGAIIYDEVSMTLATAGASGDTTQINKTYKTILLKSATDPTAVQVSFNGGNFVPLVYGLVISDFANDVLFIKNISAAPNSIVIGFGNAIISDSRNIPAAGAVQPISATDGALATIGATTDAAAASDIVAGTLMAYIKRLCAKFLSEGNNADGDAVKAAGVLCTEGYGMVFNGTTWDRVRGVSGHIGAAAWDGANIQRIKSDTNGNQIMVGAVAAGSVIGTTAPVLQGVSDGTNVQRMKGDTAGNAVVVGPVAAGSAIGTTAPVLMGGSDSTNVQRVRTDTSGFLAMVGPIADGSAVGTVAPLLLGASDGTNVKRLSAIADNSTLPTSGNLTSVAGYYNSSARSVTSGRAAFLSIDRGGKVLVTPCGTLDPVLAGYTVGTLDAAATTNATSLKAAAGMVYEVSAVNNAAYDVFIRLYNKASAPTVGTDVSYRVVRVPAGQSVVVTFPGGAYFATGIAYATTKLVAYNDATALVAHDVQLSIQYA